MFFSNPADQYSGFLILLPPEETVSYRMFLLNSNTSSMNDFTKYQETIFPYHVFWMDFSIIVYFDYLFFSRFFEGL